jgi:hypothetical protein
VSGVPRFRLLSDGASGCLGWLGDELLRLYYLGVINHQRERQVAQATQITTARRRPEHASAREVGLLSARLRDDGDRAFGGVRH